MPILTEGIHTFFRFVKIQSFLLCVKTIANHGVKKGNPVSFHFYTCLSFQCSHTPAKKLTYLSSLGVTGGKPQAASERWFSSHRAQARHVLVLLLMAATRPLNVEYFNWVIFVNSRYHRPSSPPPPHSMSQQIHLDFPLSGNV